MCNGAVAAARQRRWRVIAAALLGLGLLVPASCNPFADNDRSKGSGKAGTSAQSGAAATVADPPASNDSFDGTAIVKAVIDGDTIVAAIGTTEEHVRLLNIDTPETVDPDREPMCFGHEAAERTKSLLPKGTAVRLERDVELRDRYGRVLAFVYRQSDGLLVNLDLVANGFADVLIIKPNGALASKFTSAKSEAKAAKKGAWTACPKPFEQ